jgi:hypothetical protein
VPPPPPEESHILQKLGGGVGAGIGNDNDTLYVGSNNKEVRDYVGFAEHRLRVTVIIYLRTLCCLTYGCVSWWKRYVCISWVAVRRAFGVWSR